MQLRLPMLATAVALTAALSACGGGEDAPTARAAQDAGASEVAVRTFIFRPDPVRIDAGETVSWRNLDTAAHTVTSGTRSRPDGRFDAKLAESGGTHRQRFDKPGTYRYFCSLHSGPGMEGEVIVR